MTEALQLPERTLPSPNGKRYIMMKQYGENKYIFQDVSSGRCGFTIHWCIYDVLEAEEAKVDTDIIKELKSQSEWRIQLNKKTAPAIRLPTEDLSRR